MRLVVRGENRLERLGVRLGVVPSPFIECVYGFPASQVLITAMRLGVVEHLAARPGTPEEVAAALELAPRTVRLIVRYLEAAGHLVERAGRYRLSRRSRRWLSPDSPAYLGTYLKSLHGTERLWARLEDAARTGQAVDIHQRTEDDPWWRENIVGMYELARMGAGEVAGALDLPPSPKALLDVAGGHGWYSAQLCRRYPTLRATVVDLPAAAKAGRELLARHGFGDVVEHQEGDVRTAEFGGPYDAALCFNVIHYFTPAEIRSLLSRIHAALVPGGTLALLDPFTRPSREWPVGAGVFQLLFFLESGADTYQPDELRRWITEAGFELRRELRVRRMGNQRIFEAVKPAD
ncbi:methyltransferase [Amycolatopsis sp. YIM 10]|uniref:methyltransferase n=1 Tax=Amycolatopsis sp. YIM 10 TaxID=2653857 RepID=UPI0012904525|nr:methyltransferase [Amycolatopsis sp. YIM 10]QFU90565.1 Multifunctional cyclase-dehydratase-3-O-methyl transferase TcmN [Amycolatopsis sp. YIM 10]